MNIFPNNLNKKSPSCRVQVGVAIENSIAKCLKEHYGYDLHEVTRHEDMNEKIDRILKLKDGTEQRVQIKTRMSGKDILVCLWEPFYSVDSDKNKLGRDMVSNYDIYACLSDNGKTIRVIDGKRQKAIIQEVLDEWTIAKWALPEFKSKKYPGVEIKHHTDKWSGRPKLLMFIPVNAYKENTEIKLLEMK